MWLKETFFFTNQNEYVCSKCEAFEESFPKHTLNRTTPIWGLICLCYSTFITLVLSTFTTFKFSRLEDVISINFMLCEFYSSIRNFIIRKLLPKLSKRFKFTIKRFLSEIDVMAQPVIYNIERITKWTFWNVIKKKLTIKNIFDKKTETNAQRSLILRLFQCLHFGF